MTVLRKIDRIALILVSVAFLGLILEIALLPVLAPDFTGRTAGRITKAFKAEMLKTHAGNENKR